MDPLCLFSFLKAPYPCSGLPSTPSLQRNHSHLVFSQGRVGYFWNGGPLFLNDPSLSPVSLCGEEYAVCLQSGVPFFKFILLSPLFLSFGSPHSHPNSFRSQDDVWLVVTKAFLQKVVSSR